jgi:ssDNA-binding Zn-finger/Zn-ribbon topoisomerase 1
MDVYNSLLLSAVTMLANDRSVTTHKCPECDSHKTRRANRNGKVDSILSFINVYPYRCRECPTKNNRFYNFGRG